MVVEPASGGWRRSSMVALQDDISGSKTMAARAASDAGEAFVKATFAPLALLLSAGFSTAMDGGRRAIFQARDFSSDRPSLAVDII